MSLPYRLISRRFIVAMLSGILLLACLMGRWQQASQARNANRTAAAASSSPDAGPDAGKDAAVARLKTNESFGKLPLYFVENRGQLDKRVGYYIQGRDKTVYFSDTGVTFALHSGSPATSSSADGSNSAQRYIVKLDFVGARAGVKPEGRNAAEATFSYFTGPKENWKAGMKSYSELVYRELWPGIDLVYAGTVNRMKYTFHVRPGADPNQIKLAYRGASTVQLNPAGELEIATPTGGFKDDQPISHQTLNGKLREVKTAFALPTESPAETNAKPRDEVRQVFGFKLDAYDATQELVIDPAVLVYCGYIGGSGGSGDSEQAEDIAVDSAGNAYVTGWTDSNQSSFPVTAGPDLTYSAFTDAYVAKVNAAGTALLYCGYIGGTGSDRGYGIAVDSAGNAYIAGQSGSSQVTFPVIVGPDLTSSGTDAFVAKLNPAGSALLYCGYIGGNSTDSGYDIAIDSSGNAYVVGETFSTQTTFPDGDGFGAVPGADQTHNGSNDAFVAKVSANGTGLVYASYLGGSGSDIGWGIALDSSNNAIISGQTASDQTTFPTGTGFGALTTFDGTYNTNTDAFLAKFDAAGTALLYAGYVGGNGSDYGYDVAVNGSGAAYLAGYAASTQTTFPDGDPDNNDTFPVPGIDQTYNNPDAFLAIISSAGALTYATYIGGNGFDAAYGVAVDASNNVYLSGESLSSTADFPKDGGFTGIAGFDQTFNGNVDAFIVRLNSAGTAYDFATFLGGSREDRARDIALDSANNVYVVGFARSDESTFPVTNGPDLTFNSAAGIESGPDSFVAKINAAGTTLAYCGYIGGKGPGDDRGQSIAVDSTGNAYVAGWTTSLPPDFPVTVGPDLTMNGSFDAFVAKLNPAGTALLFLGYLGGSANDQANGIALDSSNNVYLCGLTLSDQTTFPVTVGPDLIYNFGQDAFVAKVNAAGTSLDYCGYVGGSSFESANDIAVDSGGNAYVTGFVNSTEATFPDGDGFGGLNPVLGADIIYNTLQDAFIVKVPAVPSAGLAYASYIGGISSESGLGVEIDSSGNAYVVGFTNSTQTTFPDGDPDNNDAFPVSGIDTTANGAQEGFIAKLNNVGTAFTYVSFIGGSSSDSVTGVDVDGSGNAYVTGTTFSTETTFPTGTGFGALSGFDTTFNGGSDAFVLKLNAAGSAYVYGTFVGGSGTEPTNGIALDSSGNAYVTGQTFTANFPAVDGPDLTYNGNSDAFIFKLNSAGTALIYSGYLGGDAADIATGIAVDSAGSAYLVGYTNSTETTFPVLAGPDLTFTPNSLGSEAFVAKIASPSSCNYTLSSNYAAVEGAGGHFVINVTTGAGCNWAAVSLSAIATITSGATGTGNGTVNFTVNSNSTSSPRITQLFIAGQIVQIEQSGGIGCAVTPDQLFVRHTAAAGSSSFNVNAGPNCQWAAATGFTPPTVPWVTITSALTGMGTGTVSYSFTANPDPVRRFGIIIVGGRGFQIIQEGTTPAATIVVNSTADTVAIDGACTLREAIINANTNSSVGSTDCVAGTGRDRITFNIAGAGPHTITPTSALPDVTDPAEIDGTTQAGASCTTPGGLKIELNGTSAGATAGLLVTAGNSLIRGLVINRFAQDGIRMTSASLNTVSCNYVGTDVAGNADLGNGVAGIQIQNSSNTNRVGGLSAGDGNLISGNTNDGVSIVGQGANQVIGNRIGTNIAGTAAIPNGFSGVVLNSSVINIIGGTSAAARNLIAGNGVNGVTIFFSSTNLVMGNYIGTDVTGALDLGNTSHGIEINGGGVNANNIIGGLSAGFRNVISGNNQTGIVIGGDNLVANAATGNQVLGNYIGTNAAGTSAVANSSTGVMIRTNAQNNYIGAVAEPFGSPAVAGGGNRIAFNTGDGVAMTQTGTAPISGNRVEGNQIFSNGGLGIDLSNTGAPDGVTANDALDAETGTNALQNFPVVVAVSSTGAVVSVFGTLNSTALNNFRIHVYANAACDGAGNGEGEIYLGEATALTDASGDGYFAGNFAVVIPSNYVITATATNLVSGDASEFSACLALSCTVAVAPTSRNFTAAAAGNSITVTAAPACNRNAVSGSPSWLTVTGGASGMGNGVVTYSLTANNTNAPRSSVIAINGVAHNIYQADAAHTVTLTPASNSGMTTTAPNAVVAAHGYRFSANPPISATTNPLPVTLSEVALCEVQDSLGVSRPAGIYFLTGSQLNFQVPNGTALGLATLNFVSASGSFVGTIQVANVAPTLFSADNTGAGVLRGWIERTVSGVTTREPVTRFDQATLRWVAVPVPLGAPADQVTLVILGTAFRNRTALPAVTATINGTPVTVTAAQAHPPTIGFDELRITLPSTGGLPAGLHNVAVVVDGNPANIVKVEIQ